MSTRRIEWRRGAITLLIATQTVVACGESGETPPASIGRVPQALVGDVVRTAHLPNEVFECADSHVAISSVVVPGAALGRSERALIGSSCRTDQGATIHFFDSGPDDRTVTELRPSADDVVNFTIKDADGNPFSPPYGWGSFAYRGDLPEPDLIACSNPDRHDTPHLVYRIDLSTGEAEEMFATVLPTTEVVDGTTFFDPFCEGLTWSPTDDTIFMSPDKSEFIYHYANDGTLIEEIPVPDGCFEAEGEETISGNSGLAVIGDHLLLACNGHPYFYQIRIDNAEVLATYGSPAGRAEDLEIDALTFSTLGVFWTKDAFTPTMFAVEAPLDNNCNGIDDDGDTQVDEDAGGCLLRFFAVPTVLTVATWSFARRSTNSSMCSSRVSDWMHAPKPSA